jgi:hypothetical protein
MKKDDKRANKRPERVPLHKQKICTAEAREGYKRRMVIDKPGRIDAFLRAGWTIADGDIETTHDGLAHVEGQLGSKVRRVVNRDPNAEAKHAVLMEIPIEWYEADKAEQQKLIDEQESAFDQSGEHRKSGMYGNMSRIDGSKA